MIPENPAGPVALEVDGPPAQLNRLTTFFRGIMVIPAYVGLIVLGIGAFVVYFCSWWAVLFTGRYPEGMYNYMVGVMRWQTRMFAYLTLVTDVFPPLSLADDPNYPVRLQIAPVQPMHRWRPLINWLLVIPAAIAGGAIFFVAYLGVVVAWFAILFTGRYPAGIFTTVVIALRWSVRVGLFNNWMTEDYPPFVWA